jgi:hypothetical protein
LLSALDKEKGFGADMALVGAQNEEPWEFSPLGFSHFCADVRAFDTL